MTAVTGYYCTTSKHAADLVARNVKFEPTREEFEWLGRGVYFYQEPSVAWARAQQRLRELGERPTLVRVEIDLSGCLDFLDPRVAKSVRNSYSAYRRYEERDGLLSCLGRNAG